MGCLVLLSGGADSAVVLAHIVELYGANAVAAVWFGYQQPAAAFEYKAARGLAEHFKVPLLDCMLPFGAGPMAATPTGQPGPRVVHNRNLAFLAVAAALAAQRGDHAIAIGANQDDAADYADCRNEYLLRVQLLLDGVVLLAPLVGWSKARVVRRASDLGILPMTWSCYTPDHDRPCHSCNACRAREAAYRLALAANDESSLRS